ncbi:MAG: transposase [Betaproteobacteria bacterium]|nr:transposase [Betaproteobacteria bacterium]
MARHSRLELPGVPQHVIQRGNNREPCFFSDSDYRLYLECLREASVRHDCAVHAYVLMTNHVHLLVTPRESGAVSRMMQHLGRRYVRTVNDGYRRSGTLWEGRFRSNLVDSERYFLICQQYIELNPVRSAMVGQPRDYRWSSHRYYAEGRLDPLLAEHECFGRLGQTPEERRDAYLALFRDRIDQRGLQEIRETAQQGWPLGSEQFKDQIEMSLRRPVRPGRRGRPSGKMGSE